MLINEFDLKDYKEEAYGLITEQFRDKDVFKRYLDLLLSPSEEIQLVAKDLVQKRSIETSEGVQLDMIGAIVGQPRTLIKVDILEFFGYQGAINAGGFGSLDVKFFDNAYVHNGEINYYPELVEGVGTILYSAGQPTTGNVILSDDLYRMFIKAKIAKNVTSATPEDIMRFANFIFGTSGSTIQEEGGASFRLYIGKVIGTMERALLRYIRRTASYESTLLPKPIGVKMNYGSFDYNRFFAFDGVPNAKGFGSFDVKQHDGSIIYDGSNKYYPRLLENSGGRLSAIVEINN